MKMYLRSMLMLALSKHPNSEIKVSKIILQEPFPALLKKQSSHLSLFKDIPHFTQKNSFKIWSNTQPAITPKGKISN